MVQYEYTVLILDPSPEEARVMLNAYGSKGWKVIGSYCEDRVLLRRKKPTQKLLMWSSKQGKS